MKELKGFDPFKRAEIIRPRMIDLVNKKVLLANFSESPQAGDIYNKHRVNDFFRIKQYEWPEKIQKGPQIARSDIFRSEPAGIAALRLNQSLQKHSEKNPARLLNTADCNSVVLFQVNGCNVCCWQCYVDDINKSANPQYGKLFSAEEILIQFLIEARKTSFITDPDKRINILRISGGEPFLVPEVIFWTIEALEKFELQDFIYLWVDTNLMTGDFYWRYLTEEQRTRIREFKNIGFVGCYKGYDEESFTKTCGAAPEFLKEQFKMHRRLVDEGLDVYTYLYPLVYRVLTVPELRKRITDFIDRLQQEIGPLAPLRLTTPDVKKYSPTEMRLTPERELAFELQYQAIEIWKKEMKRRFGQKANLMPHEIPVR